MAFVWLSWMWDLGVVGKILRFEINIYIHDGVDLVKIRNKIHSDSASAQFDSDSDPDNDQVQFR